tara:strand:- start:473 stop:661 length:189 start_codon:yes stop_codon:yes gene_type:complete
MDEDEDSVANLENDYHQLFTEEVEDIGVDYAERIREAVMSGKFRLTININDLRSRRPDLIPR